MTSATIYTGGDDDDDTKTTGDAEQEGGPEAGNYDKPDDISMRIGGQEKDPGEAM